MDARPIEPPRLPTQAFGTRSARGRGRSHQQHAPEGSVARAPSGPQGPRYSRQRRHAPDQAGRTGGVGCHHPGPGRHNALELPDHPGRAPRRRRCARWPAGHRPGNRSDAPLRRPGSRRHRSPRGRRAHRDNLRTAQPFQYAPMRHGRARLSVGHGWRLPQPGRRLRRSCRQQAAHARALLRLRPAAPRRSHAQPQRGGGTRAATGAGTQMKSKGIVYLVGAGPGDAGLLTLRGAELLGRADVVVYDALVNPELLCLAPKSAEIIYGGKRARDHALPQSELNQLLLAKARAGKTVVRLKGGDPYVFGRGGEEAEELADAGIPFEVVPGVSSLVAVPNYAGVPLTHRGFASRLTLITGHEDPAKEASNIDWPQVAKTPGTKVIMMGTDRIGQIAQTLIAEGMEPATPIAMVRWGTTGRQQSIAGTLATIAEVAERSRIGPPTVAVIGEVVNLRSKLNWFERRPLFGQRIVVTRTREQASQLAHRLQELGAEV